MKYLVFFSFFISFSAARAEMRLARILDNDEYTNVREDKGAHSKIIATLKKGEYFYCESSSSDWWRVTAINTLRGYVHKSRIEFIQDLRLDQQKHLFKHAFIQQKKLADSFQQAFQEKAVHYARAQKDLENYNDETYEPLLELFAPYFCQTEDVQTLALLFSTIITDKGSASETPAFLLGKCFICKTELVLSQLKLHKAEQLQLLVNQIEWGLQNEFEVDEDGQSSNAHYNYLHAQLKSMQ